MRVVRRLLLLLAVLMVIAAVVVWTLPASVAWRFAAPRVPALQLQGLDGSVWHGQAASASIAGQALGRLQWRLAPAALLHGNAHADIQLDGGPVTATGTVTRHLDGTIDLDHLHLEAPAAPLQAALGIETLEPTGKLSADVTHAVIRNTWFEVLDATATWHDAGVTGAAQASFGAIDATFSLDAQHRVVGTAHDDGKGVLKVNATFLAAPTGYTLRANLAARNASDWQTQEALQYIGQRQPDGSVLLLVEGHLLGGKLP